MNFCGCLDLCESRYFLTPLYIHKGEYFFSRVEDYWIDGFYSTENYFYSNKIDDYKIDDQRIKSYYTYLEKMRFIEGSTAIHAMNLNNEIIIGSRYFLTNLLCKNQGDLGDEAIDFVEYTKVNCSDNYNKYNELKDLKYNNFGDFQFDKIYLEENL